jgi:hypothetical protein
LIFALLAVSMTVSFWEGLRLYRKKQFREITVYASLLSAGVALLVLQLLRVKLPSPAEAIHRVFEPAGKLLVNLLS